MAVYYRCKVCGEEHNSPTAFGERFVDAKREGRKKEYFLWLEWFQVRANARNLNSLVDRCLPHIAFGADCLLWGYHSRVIAGSYSHRRVD